MTTRLNTIQAEGVVGQPDPRFRERVQSATGVVRDRIHSAGASTSSILGQVRRNRAFPVMLAVVPMVLFTAVALTFRNQLDDVQGLGYVGVFALNVVASGTLFVPVPGLAAVMAAGAVLNPVVVGLAGATGSSLGELTGFTVGAGTRDTARPALMNSRWYPVVDGWFQRHGFATIFVLAILPVPMFDAVSFAAGSAKYPLSRFIVACWTGKVIKFTLGAYAGYYGATAVLNLI
ncbi:MAG TPA: hypothetical protein DCP37_01755 [Dehalococcoidia bacterium]|nr:VTT domain-containing protein [SAR202 cluster bacterium]HAL46456.1 hypothetical protein [Dehalococcoidia bacterium]